MATPPLPDGGKETRSQLDEAQASSEGSEGHVGGGTIWARVMGPRAPAEGLREDQGGYVDEAAGASDEEDG